MTEKRIAEYQQKMRNLMDKIDLAIAKKDRPTALNLIEEQGNLYEKFVAENITEVNA